MTTPNSSVAALTPELRHFIDETVNRKVESRLYEILDLVAEEVTRRFEQREATRIYRADEIREEGAVVYDADFAGPYEPYKTYQSPRWSVAKLFERLAEKGLPRPQAGVAAPSRVEDQDLPSTLPELREQSLSAADAAARLGVNASRIRQRLLARTLFGFKDGGSWWVPVLQFVGNEVIPGLEAVLPELDPSTSPVAVARWLVLPWEDLVVDEEREIVVSPRTWLLEGRDPGPVIAQARWL